MKPRIVTTERRRWPVWAVAAGVAVGLGLCTWALYAILGASEENGARLSDRRRESLQMERRKLDEALIAEKRKAESLRDQIVYLQRSQDIDREACSTVKNSLKSLQGKVASLQEQLAFYRGIVSPSDDKAGVRVYDLKVSHTRTPRVFRYELVLIQSVARRRTVRGHIHVALQGTQSGRQRTVDLTSLVTGTPHDLVFSFKYFQELSGQFRLPEGFSPEHVSVALEVHGRSKRADDVFDWDKIQGA